MRNFFENYLQLVAAEFGRMGRADFGVNYPK